MTYRDATHLKAMEICESPTIKKYIIHFVCLVFSFKFKLKDEVDKIRGYGPAVDVTVIE